MEQTWPRPRTAATTPAELQLSENVIRLLAAAVPVDATADTVWFPGVTVIGPIALVVTFVATVLPSRRMLNTPWPVRRNVLIDKSVGGVKVSANTAMPLPAANGARPVGAVADAHAMNIFPAAQTLPL